MPSHRLSQILCSLATLAKQPLYHSRAPFLNVLRNSYMFYKLHHCAIKRDPKKMVGQEDLGYHAFLCSLSRPPFDFSTPVLLHNSSPN